jgi:hypothetical protein
MVGQIRVRRAVVHEMRCAICWGKNPGDCLGEIDGKPIHLEPGQTVIPHGPDRDLSVDEARPARQA